MNHWLLKSTLLLFSHGATDSGNKEQELIFILYCKFDGIAKEIHSQTRCLAMMNPSSYQLS